MLPQYHSLYFETTRRCNLACSYCSTGSNGKYDGSGDMTYQQIVDRVLIPAKELGTKMIEFSGGEFLLREDAYEILGKANDMGFRIAVASNGVLLNDKCILKLKSVLKDNIFISLGINSFSEDNIATRDVSYRTTEDIIKLLEKHYIGVNICVTLGKFNASDFHETVKKIRDLHLPFNRIPFVPRNCHHSEFLIEKDTMRHCFYPAMTNDFHGYVSFTPFFLSESFYEMISGQNNYNFLVPTNPSIGCWCGSFYSINPEGEVSPCALLSDHFSGGNVLKDNLSEILFKSELFQKITNRKNFGGKCGKCQFNFTCGGCRAMAFYHSGDVYGEDPTCFIEDLSEEELESLKLITEKNFKRFTKMAHIGKYYYPPEINEQNTI